MRKEFYTMENLEKYIKIENDNVLYAFTKIVEKKIYLEDKGYDFYCEFNIENDSPVLDFLALSITCTEDLLINAKYIECCYDSFEKSKIKELFNLDNKFILNGNFINIVRNHHEIIINYIEKLYDFERLNEKFPQKQTNKQKNKQKGIKI